MRNYAKKNATNVVQKLPKDHKCFGCPWLNYHDNRIVCVRMPCVKGEEEIEQGEQSSTQ